MVGKIVSLREKMAQDKFKTSLEEVTKEQWVDIKKSIQEILRIKSCSSL